MLTARRTASCAALSVLMPRPSCFVEIVPPNRSVMVHGHVLYPRLSALLEPTRHAHLLVSIVADVDSHIRRFFAYGSSKMGTRAKARRMSPGSNLYLQ